MERLVYLILFDDHIIRMRANENPSLFLDQYKGPIILDEASLVPPIFNEIKLRVDQAKRDLRQGLEVNEIDYWITGSNQTLLSKHVQESLAGRAEFFTLNTLSIHEIIHFNLEDLFLRGGWPELYAEKSTNPVNYLNGLISTFIEKDIGQAAMIEKKAAFTRTIQLLAGQVGELINYSSIASAVSVESTTVMSWTLILEQNHLIKVVTPYMNSLNKRLIKTPKIYFEDVGLAVRFQGWTEYGPLFLSPYFGHLVENLTYCELSRFFSNHLMESKIFFLRTKEKIEIDFLIELPNQRFVAVEVKATSRDFTKEQKKLLESLNINIVACLIVTLNKTESYNETEVVHLSDLFNRLKKFLDFK